MAAVKNSLPRRESERRNHPLSRHSDILTAIETRLSLLGMTYNKFIDLELCCFIPGKVLDETFAILRTITRSLADNSQPSRPHELLQVWMYIEL
jgi:F-box protein 28